MQQTQKNELLQIYIFFLFLQFGPAQSEASYSSMHEAIGAKFSAVPLYILTYQLTKPEPKLSIGFGSMRYFRDDKFFLKHPVEEMAVDEKAQINGEVLKNTCHSAIDYRGG